MTMRSLLTISLFIVNFLLIGMACSSPSDKSQQTDPMESAIPHGSTLATSSLSPEDKEKLANAKGIVATPLHVRALVDLIDKGSDDLNIYCLWKVDCPECDKLLRSLTQLKQEVDSDIMAIHHINANYQDQEDRVTSHIREMGLINNNYILFGLEDYENDEPYSALFKSDLPVLIMVNNTEGIKLIYQQAFTLDELYAIISPLTI